MGSPKMYTSNRVANNTMNGISLFTVIVWAFTSFNFGFLLHFISSIIFFGLCLRYQFIISIVAFVEGFFLVSSFSVTLAWYTTGFLDFVRILFFVFRFLFICSFSINQNRLTSNGSCIVFHISVALSFAFQGRC